LTHRREAAISVGGNAAFLRVTQDLVSYDVMGQKPLPAGGPAIGFLFGGSLASTSIQEEISAPIYVWGQSSNQTVRSPVTRSSPTLSSPSQTYQKQSTISQNTEVTYDNMSSIIEFLLKFIR
jgi:hypothetical protein